MLSAIILAAGEARRMGRLKQLLPWGHSTILETVIQNIADCDYIDDEIRVVLGAEAARIMSVLEKWNEPRLKIMKNKNYQAGILTSIWKGLESLPEKTRYIMLALGDQPLITKEIYNTILKEFFIKKPEIMVPTFNGKRGHPVLIDSIFIPEVYKLIGPGGLRSLFWKYPEKVYFFKLNDRRIIIDLDYDEDYQRLKSLSGLLAKSKDRND